VNAIQRPRSTHLVRPLADPLCQPALAHAGRVDEAKLACPELLERQPNFTCAYLKANLPISDPQFLEIYTVGLRKAGVPED